jgi:uncharacterized protein (TIRG00374 family)
MWNKRWVRWGLGLSVTAVGIWLSFRRVDLEGLGRSFAQIKWAWVVVAVTSQFIVIYLGGWRWQFLLNPKVKLSLARIFRLNILAQYANMIAPARLGEAVRAVLVAKDDKIALGYALGTVVIERILDLFLLAFFWLLLPLVIFVEDQTVRIGSAVLFCLLLMIFLFFVARRPDVFWRFSRKLSCLVPPKYRGHFRELVESGLESFHPFGRWMQAVLLIGFSFALFVGQALGAFFMFFAFDLRLPFLAALAVLMMIKVGYLPPSAPGKVGVYEYSVIIALGLFGVGKEITLSYALAMHVFTFLPRIFLGQYFIIKK